MRFVEQAEQPVVSINNTHRRKIRIIRREHALNNISLEILVLGILLFEQYGQFRILRKQLEFYQTGCGIRG